MVMAGQVSGILFILGMDAFRTGAEGSMTWSMVGFIVLTGALIGLSLMLRESEMIRGQADREASGAPSD
jgi:hypothetical protein